MEGTNRDPILLKLGSQNMTTLANCRVGDLICLYAAENGKVIGLKGVVSAIVFSPATDSQRIFVFLNLILRDQKTMAVCNTLNGSVDFQTIH